MQAGTPEELYTAPRSEMVARSMGIRNVLSAQRAGQDEGVTHVLTEVGMLSGVLQGSSELKARRGGPRLHRRAAHRAGPGDGAHGRRGVDRHAARRHGGESALSVGRTGAGGAGRKGEADLPRKGGRRCPRHRRRRHPHHPPRRGAHRGARTPAHRRRGGRAGVGVGGSLTVCKGRRMVCGSA